MEPETGVISEALNLANNNSMAEANSMAHHGNPGSHIDKIKKGNHDVNSGAIHTSGVGNSGKTSGQTS